MTQRERYHKFFTGQNPADMPLWGDWIEPYDKWVKQGLPYDGSGLKNRNFMLEYFGFEGIYSIYWGTGRLPVNIGLMPGFDIEILDKTGQYIVYRNGDGMVVKEMRDKNSSLVTQQYIDHALHGSADWQDFRDRHLDPLHPARYPDEARWAEIVAGCKNRDWVCTIDAGSFYGHIRNWMSVEGISIAMCEEPEWVSEVVGFLADFYITVLGKALRDVPDIDAGIFWEDMCYKTGPLCSPAMFRQFFLPGYQKVTEFLRDNGVKSFWVDCDGNIGQLIDLWLEGGVNGFYPLEAAAGMDPLALKIKYGKRINLWGGVDKRELMKSFEDIDRELERVAPAVALGGYIPLVDHGVPDDTPFINYCYYNKKRREMFGIKQLPSERTVVL